MGKAKAFPNRGIYANFTNGLCLNYCKENIAPLWKFLFDIKAEIRNGGKHVITDSDVYLGKSKVRKKVNNAIKEYVHLPVGLSNYYDIKESPLIILSARYQDVSK